MEKIIKANVDPAPLHSFKNGRINEEGKPMTTIYTNLQNPEKELYKIELLKEQFYLCAYCNKLLSDEKEYLYQLKIEHWYPQHFCKQEGHYETVDGMDLQHSNLLIVCGGESVNPKYKHCDSSRTPKTKLKIRPQDAEYEFDKLFRYEGTTLVSDDDEISYDINIELNLNHEDLQYKRRIALDGFRKIIMSFGKGNINKNALLNKYQNPFKDGRKAEYCTLIINEIKKF
ncbi:hypothetical protein HZQ69_07510 [Elizabethkingia anophelis]|nr:hypothetical protein [Elizabethkingia anophelis]